MSKHPPGTSIPSVPAADDAARRNARAARIVVWGAIAFGSAIGVFVYFSASRASMDVWKQVEGFTERGRAVSGEGCVSAVLDWFGDECAAPGRICLDAVPRAMGNCLAAIDRQADCEVIGNDQKPSQWAFERCAERGVDRKSRKPVKESCTMAWRSFDTFCKSGQKGVAL